jgi:hypothetical protein
LLNCGLKTFTIKKLQKKDDIHRHSNLPVEATTVLKPQLILNLHNHELSAIKYYKTGKKNKSTLRVFDFNDSFFYKMYNKTIYYFSHNYKTKLTHKMQNKRSLLE